jgi:hypothetical protein
LVARLRSFGLPPLGALLALAVSLWAFGVIVDEQIIERETRTDQRFAEWLHGRATEPLTDVFRGITRLGNFTMLFAVTLLAVVILWRRRDRIDAAFVALAALSAQVLSTGMKLGFRRDRPFFPDPLATESTFSFPSGHALVPLAVYGSIALVLARRLSSHTQRAASAGRSTRGRNRLQPPLPRRPLPLRRAGRVRGGRGLACAALRGARGAGPYAWRA